VAIDNFQYVLCYLLCVCCFKKTLLGLLKCINHTQLTNIFIYRFIIPQKYEHFNLIYENIRIKKFSLICSTLLQLELFSENQPDNFCSYQILERRILLTCGWFTSDNQKTLAYQIGKQVFLYRLLIKLRLYPHPGKCPWV